MKSEVNWVSLHSKVFRLDGADGVVLYSTRFLEQEDTAGQFLFQVSFE